jgi:signal transduction histidine kinase
LNLNSIFEEFVRGYKSRNSTGGSDLGLAISKK